MRVRRRERLNATTPGHGKRWFWVTLGGCLAVLIGLMMPVAEAAAANPPLPSSIAAIGDSITQAYDDCCSYGAHPQDSWSTGDGFPANGVYSQYQRILAMNPAILDKAYNDSVSGAKVADTISQAQAAVAQGAQYVTIEIGANDVCTGSISSMTTTAQFTAAFESTMSTLESGLEPDAHIFVASIPNIYELWSVLHGNSDAQAVWSLANICQSMLSTSNTEAQRQQVLTQEEADNAALSQVCGQYANCRWDGYATFDYPFTPTDVSTLDYFHPSQTGQGVLAGITWQASWWWPPSHGYWLVGSDGGIFSFGSAQFYGSTGSLKLQRPVVGIVPTRDDGGYWLDASDGGVFSFGDTQFYGSIPGLGLHPAGSGLPNSLNAPIVGMVPSNDDGGYFMVASDGGVFAFGDAHFAGSCPGIGGCSGAAVAVMPDASGNGYWLVTQIGNVYTFGDASYYGAPGNTGSSVTSAVRTPDGGGYWILTANGTVYNYGDAVNYGDAAGSFGGLNPATAIFTTSDGGGYWIASANGTVDNYGDAPNDGGMSGTDLNGSIIAATGF